jgi:hypothetical protein
MDDFQKQLLKRLDLIIRLQLDRGLAENPPSTTSVVHRLFDFGLSAGEVAAIIGRPMNYITAISSAKKAKSKRAQNKGRSK